MGGGTRRQDDCAGWMGGVFQVFQGFLLFPDPSRYLSLPCELLEKWCIHFFPGIFPRVGPYGTHTFSLDSFPHWGPYVVHSHLGHSCPDSHPDCWGELFTSLQYV